MGWHPPPRLTRNPAGDLPAGQLTASMLLTLQSAFGHQDSGISRRTQATPAAASRPLAAATRSPCVPPHRRRRAPRQWPPSQRGMGDAASRRPLFRPPLTTH